MFMLLMLTVISLPLAPIADETQVPDNYQGVWKIVAAVDEDGIRSTSDDTGFAESNPIELLIIGNRVIQVKDDGSSVLAVATVLQSKNGLTLDLRTGIAHDKTNSPTYWNLKLENNKLKIELAVDRYDKDPRTNTKAVPSYQAIRQRR
ncbi:hypothetical protein [Mariniblastus fucicola]|uniref:Lipocalin-like domain-containing protein n=1 Tax=Mariniblastus fucicola TaxID=980251 RepID=A0A5B9PGC8_9BACT|nr:hypothetical protein [Mariniblastus fucicola]QEG21941.1 hypothetical protein MFFC18_18020 [Mariniblastus fucicola]